MRQLLEVLNNLRSQDDRFNYDIATTNARNKTYYLELYYVVGRFTRKDIDKLESRMKGAESRSNIHTRFHVRMDGTIVATTAMNIDARSARGESLITIYSNLMYDAGALE